jgi:putative transcriptional regulator
MNNKLFDHLVLSLKEAGAIKRDEIQASQATDLRLPDSKAGCEKMGLQVEFSIRLHLRKTTNRTESNLNNLKYYRTYALTDSKKY